MIDKYKDLYPEAVPVINTVYRQIKTKIPVPESIDVIRRIRELEPFSLSGQMPIIWENATGSSVCDPYGNKWIDFTSGILVANVGHRNPAVVEQIKRQLDKSLHTYLFPSMIKYQYLSQFSEILDDFYNKIYLLTTGSEAVENAIKMACKYKKDKRPDSKHTYIISFVNSFHGRTYGAQLAGGVQTQKIWMPEISNSFIQIDYPDNIYGNTNFDNFLEQVKKICIADIACVLIEGYQGGNVLVPNSDYIKKLSEWCTGNDVLLVFDEIQSGFGRTGKMFSFEHFAIKPDIICCGKGITSSVPMSCILTSERIADLFDIGEMSNTHSGNPISLAAGLGVLQYIQENNLIEESRRKGEILQSKLHKKILTNEYVKNITGMGMVAGIHIVSKNGIPDPLRAYKIVERCFKSGLLLCIPVGYKKAVIKVVPPLIIEDDALVEGIETLAEVIGSEDISFNYEKSEKSCENGTNL